jgi:uncharacterized protein YjcR
MAQWEKAYKDYSAGMKYKDIAAKYKVTLNTVKSWKTRYWNGSKGNGKSVQRPKKGVHTLAKDERTPKKVGAPKGSRNAAGNKSKTQIKPGQRLALKHGGYSQIYWDTLSEEERELIETMETDEEFQLQEQIRLLTVRERRILMAIRQKKEKNAGQIISSVTRSETKRTFKSDEDRELYEQTQADKVSEGKILPGESYNLITVTENTDSSIMRLEQELTAIQKAKTKAIDSLSRLNLEREKLSLIREKDDIEVEDTDDVDGVIYG